MAIPLIGGILEIGAKLIDKLIPDPQAKQAALIKLAELEQSGDLAIIAGQVELNKVEAANPNVFISGWRPFVGWVCGAALAIQLVVAPLAVQISTIAGKPVPLVVMDVSLLTTLLVGMLGFGGMRTVEKLSGVAGK